MGGVRIDLKPIDPWAEDHVHFRFRSFTQSIRKKHLLFIFIGVPQKLYSEQANKGIDIPNKR